MARLIRKERSLGVAKETRKYDIPLNKGSGGLFLKILIALMTILAIFGLSASFALSEMKNKWASGLENKVTIEIPAENIKGEILSQDEIDEISQSVSSFLESQPQIETVEIMPSTEIESLVAPWLGDNINFDDVPLPGVLSVSFKSDSDVNYKNLESRIKNYGEHIRLDTHGKWLADLLQFTDALKFIAILISTLVGITTVVAVTGAILARMAIFDEELELLHLMGAGDRYIAKQLQKHSFITCLQGAFAGTFLGLVLLFITSWGLDQKDISLLPDFSLTLYQIFVLLSLPLIIAFIGMITARFTVLRVLSKMP